MTRFTRLDGNVEDYRYHTEKEATEHLMLFCDDDSGLYKNVAVIDEKDYVIHLLPFVNGKPLDVLDAGCLVQLRDEFASEEERRKKDIFVVTNMNEWSGRVNITCITTNMALKPTECVGMEMVKRTMTS